MISKSTRQGRMTRTQAKELHGAQMRELTAVQQQGNDILAQANLHSKALGSLIETSNSVVQTGNVQTEALSALLKAQQEATQPAQSPWPRPSRLPPPPPPLRPPPAPPSARLRPRRSGATDAGAADLERPKAVMRMQRAALINSAGASAPLEESIPPVLSPEVPSPEVPSPEVPSPTPRASISMSPLLDDLPAEEEIEAINTPEQAIEISSRFNKVARRVVFAKVTDEARTEARTEAPIDVEAEVPTEETTEAVMTEAGMDVDAEAPMEAATEAMEAATATSTETSTAAAEEGAGVGATPSRPPLASKDANTPTLHTMNTPSKRHIALMKEQEARFDFTPPQQQQPAQSTTPWSSHGDEREHEVVDQSGGDEGGDKGGSMGGQHDARGEIMKTTPPPFIARKFMALKPIFPSFKPGRFEQSIHRTLDKGDGQALWRQQLTEIDSVLALVEMAGPLANSIKFGIPLMVTLSSLVLALRAQSYECGLSMLTNRLVMQHEALAVVAIDPTLDGLSGLITRKAVSGDQAKLVRDACNRTLSTLIESHPTPAVLQALLKV